ncbi:MAG TPA: M1 family metallopeptidase [Intrasporangiaceae bacterium]|nr:M1 family metallopeptidase [Intrasporangiaceae bacterium]
MNPPDPYLPGLGDPRYAVLAYDLDLDYTIATNHLAGRTRLECRILTDTATLALDLSGLRALTVRCTGATVKSHAQRANRLTIRFTERLPAGTEITLTVSTKGAPRPRRGPDGMAGWEELDDGIIVASQPHGASTWFPCNDRTSNKARYRIALACEPEYAVIANGRLAERRKAGRKVRWVYVQDEPMAPYLATVQIGRYEVREQQASIPCRIVGPPRLRTAITTAFADQPRMIDLFEEVFGPYPFTAGYTAVVTDDDLEIPLEAQTMATFGANFTNRQWESQRLIAHELSHQWWGNSVTAGQARDIWLHEGFACYAEWLWSPLGTGVPTQQRVEHHWNRLAALPQDLVVTDPGAKHLFDDRVYKRGALTLAAVRAELGDDRFFSLLRTWGARHAHSVVSTADFEALVAEIAGRSLTGLFDAWLRSPALPALP